MAKKPKPKPTLPKVKKYDFSETDQEFLQPRQVLINQYRLVVNDLDQAMQAYIINVCVPRLAIDTKKYAITYNVSENKLVCTEKPPQIIKPNGQPKIVVPPGVKLKA